MHLLDNLVSSGLSILLIKWNR